MEDTSPIIFIICIVCLIATWPVVLLRCYVRIFMKKCFGIDDVLAILANIILTLGCAAMFYACNLHLWRPDTDQTISEIRKSLRIYYFLEICYPTATGSIKLSFSLTLLRIGAPVVRKPLFVIMATTTVMNAFLLFYMVFTCDPVPYYWKRADPSERGTCRDPNKLITAAYVHSSIMLGADMSLTILPMYMVSSMNLNARTKVTVVALLALGSVASIATLCRFPYVSRLNDEHNFLRRSTELVIFSGTEVVVSIAATSISTLRPLITRSQTTLSKTVSSRKSSVGPLLPKKPKDPYNITCLHETNMEATVMGHEKMDTEIGLPVVREETNNEHSNV